MVRVRMTYLIATIALVAALVCLFGVLSPGPSAWQTWMVLAISAASAICLLSLEARRDSYAFAQFATVAVLFPGALAVAVLIAAESEASRSRAAIGLGVCAAGLTLAIAMLWRERRATAARSASSCRTASRASGS